MRKFWLLWMVTLITFSASCGTGFPAITPETPPPSASPSNLAPDSPPSSLSIPYGKNIRFEQISIEEGLSQSVVNAILQDQKGFLWVGTDDGLNRYDGYDFKVYKPDANTPSSLSDRAVTTLVEDEQGYLWIGTRTGGLNRYDPHTNQFKHYIHSAADDDSIAGNEIHALCLDEDGLWIGTNNGLDFLHFETDSFTHYYAFPTNQPESQSRTRIPIRALFKDTKGLLWIGSANAGLSVYDKTDKSFTVHKFSENNLFSLSHNRVLSIAEGQEGEMWIGTGNGLNLYHTEDRYFTRFANSESNPDSLAGNTVYTLYKDRSGGLWIGTNNGLDRYDPQNDRFIHHQHQPTVSNSLSNNQVFTIHEDASGVLWIGTYGGGLNKYNRQQDRFAYYHKNPNNASSLSSNFIFPILADNEGYVWIGTLDGGLNRFDPITEQFTYFEHNPNDPTTISNDSVISLYSDRQGVLWIGTTRGLNRFNPETNSFLSYQQVGTGDNISTRETIFAIREDTLGNLWIGTNRGLYLFNRDDQKFQQYEPEEGNPDFFSGYHVNAIIEDSSQNLWVGTFDDGLIRINLETNEITQYTHNPENPSSLGSNAIMVIHEDKDGILWIGTYGGGLDRFEPGNNTFSHFTENEGLPNNIIYGILEDEMGHLWVSTNYGLSKFDPTDRTFRNFTVSDGLQSNEFNQNAFAKDQNGRMYFGGINGLILFSPEEIKDNPYAPKVSLTSLTRDGTPHADTLSVEYLQNIALEWPQDSFEFEFTAFAYEQPSRNQYAYMLEGFDNDWINIGTQRNGRYTNLPGGNYTLRLRGSNSDGTWNEQGQAISIIVVPPFWETWWFLGLAIVVLGVGLIGGLRWGVKNIETRNRELERLVKKRTADLEKRTGEIEALYQADEKILRSVTLNQVFQTLVDVSITMLKADRSVVFLWNESKNKILPHVSRGFQPETLSVLQFDYGEGMVGRAMKTSAAVIVSHLKPNELRDDIRTAMDREGIRSYAHFPIIIDGKVVAIFNVAYTRPDALNKDAVRLFTALVNRASLSIANMQLFEQTKDLAVMEERNRLARDLHDSAKQKAFAALAQLGTVNGLVRSKNGEIAPNLNEAETLIYEVIQELNFLIQEIYPIALQEKGLQTTLREYIFEWENRNDITSNLTILNDRQLPLELEQAIYRLVQEALANVARHSKASRVDISLIYHTDSLQVTIADNGCGFDMNQKAKGLGFRSMRDRIGSLRGTVQIQSTPGQGTCLVAQVPIKNNGGNET